jgi:hypothetical protein
MKQEAKQLKEAALLALQVCINGQITGTTCQ